MKQFDWLNLHAPRSHFHLGRIPSSSSTLIVSRRFVFCRGGASWLVEARMILPPDGPKVLYTALKMNLNRVERGRVLLYHVILTPRKGLFLVLQVRIHGGRQQSIPSPPSRQFLRFLEGGE